MPSAPICVLAVVATEMLTAREGPLDGQKATAAKAIKPKATLARAILSISIRRAYCSAQPVATLPVPAAGLPLM